MGMQMEDLDSLYQEIVLDHYKSPRNQGLIQEPDMDAEGFNPFCGDKVVLTAGIDEGGQIKEVGLTGEGCAISQSSASMLSESIKGLDLEQAKKLIARFRGMMQGNDLSEEDEESLGDLVVLQGVRQYPIRIKCALLAWSTLQDAIANLTSKK